MVVLRREELLDVADDARDVGDDVLREQDAFDRVGADALDERVDEDRAVEAEEPADAIQGETEAQLDRRELRRRSGSAARSRAEPSGILVLMMPMALTREQAVKVEFQCAGILATLVVEAAGIRRP